MSTDKSVLSRLKKLLAMGNDPRTNENEAEAALRMAENLMRAHGLESADLADAVTIEYDMTSEIMELEHGAKVPLWINLLSIGVEAFTDTAVRIVRVKARYADIQVHRLLFSGVREDVEIATWLMRYLMDAIDRERKKDNVGNNVDSYRKGAATALQRRMLALREERNAVFKTTGTALVVVDAKLAAVSEKFGKGESKQIEIRGNYEANKKGRAAGERIPLNATLDKHEGTSLPIKEAA